MAEYNVSKSIKAQDEYCKEKGFPHFAPRSGVCWSCNQNIYEKIVYNHKDFHPWNTGLTVEQASRHITGCPHCNRTYCD